MKETYKIMTVCNKNKNTLHDVIDSLNPKSLDWLKPIDKGSCNLFRFEGSFIRLLDGFCLNKDISNCLVCRAPETRILSTSILWHYSFWSQE